MDQSSRVKSAGRNGRGPALIARICPVFGDRAKATGLAIAALKARSKCSFTVCKLGFSPAFFTATSLFGGVANRLRFGHLGATNHRGDSRATTREGGCSCKNAVSDRELPLWAEALASRVRFSPAMRGTLKFWGV